MNAPVFPEGYDPDALDKVRQRREQKKKEKRPISPGLREKLPYLMVLDMLRRDRKKYGDKLILTSRDISEGLRAQPGIRDWATSRDGRVSDAFSKMLHRIMRALQEDGIIVQLPGKRQHYTFK
jgi:hypothetical protein